MSNEFIVKYRPLDKIECCFDIVAVLATMLPFLATMSNEISSFRQSQNKLNMFRKDKILFGSVAKNGNNVEATSDFVERIVRLVAFDNVASTLLLVWTRLNGEGSR